MIALIIDIQSQGAKLIRRRNLQGPSPGDGIPTTSYHFSGHSVLNPGDARDVSTTRYNIPKAPATSKKNVSILPTYISFSCTSSQALNEDPAKRLAFRCTYQSMQGSQKQTWLETSTEKAVFRINTLVDTIRNIPRGIVSITSRRHHYPANGQPWRYTTGNIENRCSSDTSSFLQNAYSTRTAPS